MSSQHSLRLSHCLLSLTLAATVTAQILTSGNSQLPACAQSCTLLNQAVQACGGQTSATQGIWSCFCQSAYLSTLYQSPTNICDAFCTNPSDNQQVMTWYQSNCGTDDGASEHSGSGSGTQTTAAQQSSSTSPSQSSSTAAGSSTTSTSSGSSQTSDQPSSSSGSWWSTHYKWIIMLIVIFVGLLIIAALALWLKRRHDRKQDQINGSFNEGITTRSAPNMSSVNPNSDNSPYPSAARGGPAAAASASGVLEPVGSGRASPARTRDAFMPYGYGYSRSESRLERSGHGDDTIESVSRGSPLARGGTPVNELEKSEGKMVEGSGRKGQKRRVLVRERDIGKDGDR